VMIVFRTADCLGVVQQIFGRLLGFRLTCDDRGRLELCCKHNSGPYQSRSFFSTDIPKCAILGVIKREDR
jgi:hypothetical protein